jgi:ABC-type transporter Mla subunit MlaD
VAYDDKPIKDAIAAIKPYDDKPIQGTIAIHETLLETLRKTPLSEILKQTSENTELLKTQFEGLKETVTQQKKDFDALLESADKSVKEYFAQNKKELVDKDTQIKELTEKLDRSIKETAEAKRIAENVDDKLQPGFKGHAGKPLKETAPDFTYNPAGAK